VVQAFSLPGVCSRAKQLGMDVFQWPAVGRDFAEAVRWHRLAAAQGVPPAQWGLGMEYRDGQGVPQDFNEAAKWLKLSASQGFVDAQNDLGVLYLNGQGVPKDLKEAARLYELAAKQGSVVAQNNLGGLYRDGQGVEKNTASAIEWFKKAADQGAANARYNLGTMYSGVTIGGGPYKHDEEAIKAIKWFKLAASQGFVPAQRMLGGYYEQGLGLPRDLDEASKWYKLVAASKEDGVYAQDAKTHLALIQFYLDALRSLPEKSVTSLPEPVMIGTIDITRFAGLKYGDSIAQALQLFGVPGAIRGNTVLFDGDIVADYDSEHGITFVSSNGQESHGRDGLLALFNKSSQTLDSLGPVPKTMPFDVAEPDGSRYGVWPFSVAGKPGELRICCVNGKGEWSIARIDLTWIGPPRQ